VDAKSKKLHELEKNVVNDTPKTKTVLHIDDPIECKIHDEAYEILVRQHDAAVELQEMLTANPNAEINIHALDLTPEEKTIVDKSSILMHHRVMELFDHHIAQFVHLNDPIGKWIFYSRLGWFISEMKEWLYWLWRENQVFETPGYFDMCAGEQEKLYQPIRKNWRKWLTENSWKNYYENHPPKIEQTPPEMTPEEIEEDRKQVEKDNAEEEAKDAKFLKEKCPSCKEKCSWYHETVKELGL
jgi:hypothetical protein